MNINYLTREPHGSRAIAAAFLLPRRWKSAAANAAPMSGPGGTCSINFIEGLVRLWSRVKSNQPPRGVAFRKVEFMIAHVFLESFWGVLQFSEFEGKESALMQSQHRVRIGRSRQHFHGHGSKAMYRRDPFRSK